MVPGPKPAIVHIAAILGAGGSGERLAECRGDAEAADHRVERQDQIFKSGRRVFQSGGEQLPIDQPCHRLARRQAGDGAGIDDVRSERR